MYNLLQVFPPTHPPTHHELIKYFKNIALMWWADPYSTNRNGQFWLRFHKTFLFGDIFQMYACVLVRGLEE